MDIRKGWVGICFLLFTAGTSSAGDVRIEIEGRYWITDLTAEANVTSDDLAGTDVNFKSDLGLKDENFPEGRFTWHVNPRHKLRFAYNQIGYSGDRLIEKDINFAGETFEIDEQVITDLDVQYLRLGWAWQFINIDDGKIKLGTLLEAKGFWVDVALEAPDQEIKESEKFAIALPTLGAALEINPHRMVSLFAEISGLPAGRYGYFFDAEAGIKIMPVKNLGIIAGYRIFDIEAKDDPDYANLKIEGLFVGASLRF